jgi:metallo-beta-lactamase family protein
MELTFWGAARQVTGSMHLLTLASGYRILIDCGLQYERGEPIELNENFPFEPSSINLLVLTHAHIDHSGNIPTLIKQGYSGQVLCTEPTAALVENLLNDSVNVQLAESGAKRRKGGSNHKSNTKVLYGQKDVSKTIDRLITLGFKQKFKVNEEVGLTFYPAGHILGAASVLVEVTENGETKRVGFTGDLGKMHSKIVVDPEVMPQLDYLISECTYGNRLHKATENGEDELFKYVKKNCIDAPGRLVIPAFSVGRTQAILFSLNQLYQKGLLQGIKVFTDSRLGIASTKIHEKYGDYLNEESKIFGKEYGELFEFQNLRVLESESDQKELAYHSGPCIIVSSAGMVEGGRIQQHIRNNIQNPLCTILIAGFCAEGTLGHRLQLGQPTIKIKNKESAVYAKVTSTDVFSAHPDREGLLSYMKSTMNPNLKKIFLVHGEGKTIEAFGNVLAENGINNYCVPTRGDKYKL